MSLIHRVGRSLGVAGVALALVVGTAFAHDTLSNTSPVGSTEDAPPPPAPVVVRSAGDQNDQQGDVQDQAGDQNDQQGDAVTSPDADSGESQHATSSGHGEDQQGDQAGAGQQGDNGGGSGDSNN